jgi:hypothetical protein
MFGIDRAILSILRPNGTHFYRRLVHFVIIWYIFTRFGMLYREKSGNPAPPPNLDELKQCFA